MSIIITMEGYTLPSGYILKELCIMFQNGEFKHFLFSKPDIPLLKADKHTIKYTTKYISNLNFEDGDVPYVEIKAILEKQKESNIYTYSEIAEKVLQNHLPTTSIENVQDMGFRMPDKVPDSRCFRNHNQRYCAKAKAIEVMKFLNIMKI